MPLISRTIVIDRSPEVVRSTFLDFPSHAKWNPFFVKFEVVGDTKEVVKGTQFNIDMMLKGDKSPTNMKPTVLVNNEKELRWKGKLFADFVFVGEHYFYFNPIQGGKATEVVQSEEFGGILAPVLLAIGMIAKTEERFGDLNEGLKKEAEGRP